jgi:hypothetical protein
MLMANASYQFNVHYAGERITGDFFVYENIANIAYAIGDIIKIPNPFTEEVKTCKISSIEESVDKNKIKGILIRFKGE